MNIFSRRVKKKHLEKFEISIREMLKYELPQLEKVIGIGRSFGISFVSEPKGIYINYAYKPQEYELLRREHKKSFNLYGISVFNYNENCYKPITLYYLYDRLTRVNLENPEYFHRDFDLNKIKLSEVKLEYLKIENPDQKVAQRALKNLTREQIELLELDDTFEIEVDQKLFYTILDLEDGNYIAVDKNGKIYRLNHDHEEMVKLIADSPAQFFDIYNGQKSKIENFF